ncbi:hypothetical protein OA505_00100 [Alphaproteobacteria bacterium]|nr:hypothetical protein [Alphaproteobacteria bacterium]
MVPGGGFEPTDTRIFSSLLLYKSRQPYQTLNQNNITMVTRPSHGGCKMASFGKRNRLWHVQVKNKKIDAKN